jgi:TPR repeat protein
MSTLGSRRTRGLFLLVKSRVKLVMEAVLNEETFQRIYDRPDDFARKAMAHKRLREAISELKAGAKNYGSEVSKAIDSWAVSDFDDLTEEQLMTLAKTRFEGAENIEKDLTLAIEAWKAASSRGNIEATYSLGVCFRDGVGVAKDEQEAFRLLFPLAEDYNNPYAHVSVEIFNLSISQLHYSDLIASQYSCGIMRLNGEGTEVNHKEAFKHFQVKMNLHLQLHQTRH